VDKLISTYTEAGVDIHYMTEAEFNTWMEFAKKTAWKNFAETVDGGQELLNLAALEDFCQSIKGKHDLDDHGGRFDVRLCLLRLISHPDPGRIDFNAAAGKMGDCLSDKYFAANPGVFYSPGCSYFNGGTASAPHHPGIGV
jgi:hypothetical protein